MCLLCTTHGDPERELAVVELMREQRAEAVILVGGAWDTPTYAERTAEFARALAKSGSRLVLCGRPAPEEGVPAAAVQYDNEGAAYATTSYLLANGHRRIAYVGRTIGLSTTDERVAGHRRALTDGGMDFDASLVRAGTFTRESGAALTDALVKEHPDVTAVFAATDVVAAGVLGALRRRGVRVPEDMSVVGFDDIPLASDLTPALTTVHVPQEQLGREAVRLALHGGAEERVMLGTHLVIRDSVAPPRS